MEKLNNRRACNDFMEDYYECLNHTKEFKRKQQIIARLEDVKAEISECTRVVEAEAHGYKVEDQNFAQQKLPSLFGVSSGGGMGLGGITGDRSASEAALKKEKELNELRKKYDILKKDLASPGASGKYDSTFA